MAVRERPNHPTPRHLIRGGVFFYRETCYNIHMTPLQYAIVDDLLYMEKDMGPPTFTWQGNTYPFVASISSFTRQLESGGYEPVKLLSSTVRILNHDGTYQFSSNVIPQAQQTFLYNIDGQKYRVETVKIDPTNSHFRMIAVGTARGI